MAQIYKSYMFRNKDPEIDRLRTLTQKTYGGLDSKSLKEIELDGGPTVGAQRGWYFGKTRRPQNATLEAAGRAMGFKRTWVKL